MFGKVKTLFSFSSKQPPDQSPTQQIQPETQSNTKSQDKLPSQTTKQESPRFGGKIHAEHPQHTAVGLHGQSQHTFIKQSQHIPPHADVWITSEELGKHTAEGDAWMSLEGVVYNVTTYMSHHPGGKEKLLEGCGKESKNLFDENHPWVSAKSLLKKVRVGYLTAD